MLLWGNVKVCCDVYSAEKMPFAALGRSSARDTVTTTPPSTQTAELMERKRPDSGVCTTFAFDNMSTLNSERVSMRVFLTRSCLFLSTSSHKPNSGQTACHHHASRLADKESRGPSAMHH